MKPKFRVNDKVFVKSVREEYFGCITKITKGNLNVNKHNETMFEGNMKVEGKKWGFKNYREKDLTLMCNEDRNCKICKHKLKCITEGV